MSKHLSLSDRILIEKFLHHDYTFASMARKLDRSPTTISREVKRYRVFSSRFSTIRDNDCTEYQSCIRNNLCKVDKFGCFIRCKLCNDMDCRTICPSYVSTHCEKLDKPPYVCTACPKEKTCKKNHAYYSAHRANAEYLQTLKNSRSGIRTSPERLMEISDILSPLILKGQSINHIFAYHGEEIGLSEKTIYNYIDMNAFSVKNMDLPKKVVYRQRRPKKVLTKLEYQYRKGRTYDCFNSFIAENPSLNIVEMDTVKGARGKGKVLLTMIFRNSSFMLMFLMPDGTQESVTAVFDMLTEKLGLKIFRKLFGVILTDNGVEFKNPIALEHAPNGAHRTRIFYCDPQASWQKPHVEKNHTLLRRIIPKGTSFNPFSQKDITVASCHVNSVARELLGNKTPFEMLKGKEYEKLLALLELTPVPPDSVILKPTLLKY